MSKTYDLEEYSIATGKQRPLRLEVESDEKIKFGRFKFEVTPNFSRAIISKKVLDLLGYKHLHYFITENGIFSNSGDKYNVSWREDNNRNTITVISTGNPKLDIYEIIRHVGDVSAPSDAPEVKPEPPKPRYYQVPEDWNGQHHLFDRVMSLLKVRMNVYLYGDAGTGKNVMAQNIAEAMNVPFYMTGKIVDVYTGINGFIDAHGVYHETELYKALKSGGVFFFDEVDSSDPEALIKINALLANGYIDLPVGRIEISEDKPVYFILAGNTCGSGSSGVYIRQRLDGASLNRMVKLSMDYDPNIEYSVAGDTPEIADLIGKIREFGRENEIDIVAGTRDIIQIKAMRANGFDARDALESSCLATLAKDDREMVYNHVRSHEYFKS